MNKQKTSYRKIIKAASIFGGVQIIQIIIQIIRSKIIAILLGPTGIGISTLFTSTISLIEALTNFGLGKSAVRNISAANASNDKIKTAKVIIVLRRLVWITGTFGAIIMLLLSPWLSRMTFGNSEYTIAFIWLSVALLFKQVSIGQLTLLQGLRKIEYLAKANLSGSFLGLVITAPLYYYFRIDAIVPGIIITGLISLLLSWHFSQKIKTEQIKISKAETISKGKDMLTMGFMISLSGLIALGGAYIVRIFISNTGGIDQVGLYAAGFAIINVYAGLVFSAMGTDYYPRLSEVAHNDKLCNQTINQQIEILLLILAPLIIFFIIYIKWIIIILYSNQFISIYNMLQWAAIGLIFKAGSWSIGFILLAKGHSKFFLYNELISSSYMLGFNILGYYYGGLTGLGVSFLIGYFLHLLQLYYFSKIKYKFNFDIACLKIFIIQLLFILSSFIIIKSTIEPYSYIISSGLIILSCYYAYKELDKRIDIKNFLSKKNN